MPLSNAKPRVLLKKRPKATKMDFSVSSLLVGSPAKEPEASVFPPVTGASLMGRVIWALDNPAEFSGFVVSYAPCANEKVGYRNTGSFVASNGERYQFRMFVRLLVDDTECRPRHRDNDTVILYLNAEPDGLGRHGLVFSA